MSLTKIATDQANGSAPAAGWNGGRGTFSAEAANWDGATATLEARVADVGAWWAVGADSTLTADGGAAFELAAGYQIRVTVSGGGGSEEVNAWVGPCRS